MTLHNIDLLCYFGSERGDVKDVQTGDTNFVENDLMNTLHQMRVQLGVVFFFLTKEHEKLSTTLSHRRKLLQTQGAQEVSLASNSLWAYNNVVTTVRISDGDTDDFSIMIGLHQRSALSPYLFALVMDEVTRDI